MYNTRLDTVLRFQAFRAFTLPPIKEPEVNIALNRNTSRLTVEVDWASLNTFKPSEEVLQDFRKQCHIHIETVLDLIRQHQGLPEPKPEHDAPNLDIAEGFEQVRKDIVKLVDTVLAKTKSSGGAMPSPADAQLGHNVAADLIETGKTLTEQYKRLYARADIRYWDGPVVVAEPAGGGGSASSEDDERGFSGAENILVSGPIELERQTLIHAYIHRNTDLFNDTLKKLIDRLKTPHPARDFVNEFNDLLAAKDKQINALNVLNSNQRQMADSRDIELQQWQRYATYCNSCANSGERSPMDFGAFVARTQWDDPSIPKGVAEASPPRKGGSRTISA